MKPTYMSAEKERAVEKATEILVDAGVLFVGAFAERHTTDGKPGLAMKVRCWANEDKLGDALADRFVANAVHQIILQTRAAWAEREIKRREEARDG